MSPDASTFACPHACCSDEGFHEHPAPHADPESCLECIDLALTSSQRRLVDKARRIAATRHHPKETK